MPSLQVAHIREQGVNLIIAPLNHSFGQKLPADQDATIGEIQHRARQAGLAGTVIPVWEQGGRMRFIAPPNYHPFFRNLNMSTICRSLNKELTW
jgi:hypothetical protein